MTRGAGRLLEADVAVAVTGPVVRIPFGLPRAGSKRGHDGAERKGAGGGAGLGGLAAGGRLPLDLMEEP
jgi:putative cofactor-binding repeat protein